MMRLALILMVLTGSILLQGCDPEPVEVEPSAGTRGMESLDEPTSPKEAVQQALDLSKNDPTKAIAILESALKTWPGDREMLLLLSVNLVLEGEKAVDKGKRSAMLHKSFAAFSEIQRRFPMLNQAEKSFQLRIEYGEVRALALEGKSAESFAILKELMTSGAGDFDSIETIDDLKPVFEMPEFQELAESLYVPKLAEAKKQVAEDMVALKPFRFEFKLKDLDGKEVTLAEYKGKVTIVDLWGTWCPPCRREIPHFVALAKKYKDQGLEIVGINCNEVGSAEEIKKTVSDFVKAFKIEYKCVISEDGIEEKVPGFQGFPTTLFFDRTGKIREVFYQSEPKSKLEAAILLLLEEGAKPH
jgi:thiol-disulfide isomerase/thioredoxin